MFFSILSIDPTAIPKKDIEMLGIQEDKNRFSSIPVTRFGISKLGYGGSLGDHVDRVHGKIGMKSPSTWRKKILG